MWESNSYEWKIATQNANSVNSVLSNEIPDKLGPSRSLLVLSNSSC